MATASELTSCFEGNLAGIPLPLTLHLPVPMNDAQLLEFSSRNSLYRMERAANGDLEIMTPVGGNGSRWEAYVVRELDLWAERAGGICFSSSGGFSLPDGSVRSPDTAWISQDRWDALTAEQRSSFPPLCPDFVIELRSSSDSRAVLERKMQTWLLNGVKLAWLIDPQVGEIVVYSAETEAETLNHPEWVQAGPPVYGFRLHCARFWKE